MRNPNSAALPTDAHLTASDNDPPPLKRRQLEPILDSESSDFEAVKRAKMSAEKSQDESEMSATNTTTTPPQQPGYAKIKSKSGGTGEGTGGDSADDEGGPSRPGSR